MKTKKEKKGLQGEQTYCVAFNEGLETNMQLIKDYSICLYQM